MQEGLFAGIGNPEREVAEAEIDALLPKLKSVPDTVDEGLAEKGLLTFKGLRPTRGPLKKKTVLVRYLMS